MGADGRSGMFGELLKKHRTASGSTLREFCRINGLDAGNYSRVERGLFAPPGEATIRRYANALGIEIGSDEYTELVDAAAVDRANLPTEVLSDEQLVKELPVLFRTLRGDPVPEEKLDRLVELIRQRGGSEDRRSG